MTTLTYCTNVHPGADLAEVERSLATWTVPVARAFAGAEGAFPVGLWLSARSATELAAPDRCRRFGEFLAANRLALATLNCFPFGGFHAEAVKEAVYRPDWRDARRVDYTLQAARAAARLAPPGAVVPISTLAGAGRVDGGAATVAAIGANLGRVAAEFARLEQETGRELVLCLEPEPFTLLETVADAVAFFEREVWARDSAARRGFVAAGGVASAAESALRRHLALCYDTCHQAVLFEDGGAAIARLDAAGIRIGKVQLSSALRTEGAAARAETLAALAAFREPRWLHQAFLRQPDGTLTGHLDLDLGIAALAAAPDGAELRVHFHVPIDRANFGVLATTRRDLDAVAAATRIRPPAVFEVETYTFPALPAGAEPRALVAALVAELAYARTAIGGD
ncbi:MAG: hypothetical protein FJ293_05645 [Planctomycetes bacterium]|nr:hypothetical protein [Planctomycetota bacterium]